MAEMILLYWLTVGIAWVSFWILAAAVLTVGVCATTTTWCITKTFRLSDKAREAVGGFVVAVFITGMFILAAK